MNCLLGIASPNVLFHNVLGPLSFLKQINDFYTGSNLFDCHPFSDDANLLYKHEDIPYLVRNINIEPTEVHTWLWVNRSLLNIENSKGIFPQSGRKISFNVELESSDKLLK